VKNIAVVILNYNTFDDTVICVDSIKKFTKKVSYKIYIVDNASPDKSGEQLLAKYTSDSGVDVLRSDVNKGFSGGNNIGIRAALNDGYEYIYLLNSDIILENDAFSLMQDRFETSKDVAIVGPHIVNSIGEYVQFARPGITLALYLVCRRTFATFFPKLEKKLRFFSYNPEENYVFDGMLNGCCFGMKACFIREHDCLDENLFMYYEEDVLAYVLKRNCKKALIVSNAKIIHNEGIATKKSSKDRMLFTRFYRWTSVLYVLRNYAKVNFIICKLISTINIMEWRLLALRNRAYKEKLQDFVSENKRVLRTVKR